MIGKKDERVSRILRLIDIISLLLWCLLLGTILGALIGRS
jgi:hypothetical protein